VQIDAQLVTFIRLVILSMVPYVLASQGTMLAGRAGIFNVAQEGIMLIGAVVGFLIAYLYGGLIYGLVLATLAGGLAGLILAYLTTTLHMDQFVVGLALFFLCLGLASLLYKVVIGVTLEPPLIPTLPNLPLPGLSQVPLVGELFDQNGLTYLAVGLSLFLYYLIYHTRLGLELRAVGENPQAADSLGVNGTLMRYVTSIVGSGLIGLAGAYLPMVHTGTFTDGIVRGRGWLAIALTFFGGWSPHSIFFGALFFAGIEVLAFRVQVGGGHVPYQFLMMLPYLATMLVMVFAFKRARPPASLGHNYDRERRQ
jgi:ABC-type uncharacterized transport system permease subunit